MDDKKENSKWGWMQWMLLITIVLMIVFAIAYFFFDLPVKFIPIIFVFPFFGGIFRRKKE
ncbi:hypothetical protein [Prevotella sp. 10(H)]|uniref:hypothetical protein n=1 Tax=Prevotella sp. 10(H) TaxID=1158294 RepID=UPI0004A749B6|nr:hypothetical protein [Prevotella sp. 10(H)]